MSQAQSLSLKVLDLVPFGSESADKEKFFALRLERPTWKSWRPGQFVMVRPTSFGLDLPWARPLGICHVTAQHLICFFQVVGKGTARMADLKSGDKVQVWGPLGNSFAMEPETSTLLLAGGMGIVPFVGYVHEHPKPWNLSMIFGHRASLRCYPLDSLNERITVDTLRESVPGDLENFIYTIRESMAEMAAQKGLVLACGPEPFLKTVQAFALELNVRTQLSLESRMACGVGACLGCVTHTTDAWPVEDKKSWPVQTCTQGPIFWAEHITL